MIQCACTKYGGGKKHACLYVGVKKSKEGCQEQGAYHFLRGKRLVVRGVNLGAIEGHNDLFDVDLTASSQLKLIQIIA